TMSAGSPFATARLWSVEAPYDALMLTPLPAGVAWNAGISFAYAAAGVEYATRLIVTSLRLAVALPATSATASAATAARTAVIEIRRMQTPDARCCRQTWSTLAVERLASQMSAISRSR